MRLAGRVEDRDCPVTIQLDFEDPIWVIKRRFCTLRHHRRDEIGGVFLGISLKRVKLTQKDALKRCLDWLQRYAANVLDHDLLARFDPAFSPAAIFCFAAARRSGLARAQAKGRSQPILFAPVQVRLERSRDRCR